MEEIREEESVNSEELDEYEILTDHTKIGNESWATLKWQAMKPDVEKTSWFVSIGFVILTSYYFRLTTMHKKKYC